MQKSLHEELAQITLTMCNFVLQGFLAKYSPALFAQAMLCYAAVLCWAVLCYAMLCYAMLCYAMLCYAMLRYALGQSFVDTYRFFSSPLGFQLANLSSLHNTSSDWFCLACTAGYPVAFLVLDKASKQVQLHEAMQR